MEEKKQEEESTIKVVFSVSMLSPNVDSNLMLLTATRQDGVVHKTVYNKKYFPTMALKRARKRLIGEIMYITGRFVDIVLNQEIN